MSSNSNKKELRNKYREDGLKGLNEYEKIALLLSYSSGKSFSELAEHLSTKYGSLKAAINAEIISLVKNSGLDDKAVVLLKLIPELSRIYFTETSNIKCLLSSSDAIKYFESIYIGILDEMLTIVCTDENLRIIDTKKISQNSKSAVDCSIREIIEFAMYNDSSNIFIAHNHPLGNSNPSKSDFVATDNIFRSLEKIDIHLIDHIIVGKDSVISMKELPFTMAFKAGYDSGYKVQDASEIKK